MSIVQATGKSLSEALLFAEHGDTVLIIAINRMMKCTKDIDKNSNLGFPRLVKDHQKILKSADKHQRYTKSTLFLLNSHEIIKK